MGQLRFLGSIKREFSGYNANAFSKDLLAGLTVTAVALPLALAFGVSSGLDAASGLITAILAGLIIGALGGASFQISGPTGAMAAILISLSVRHGVEGVFIAGFLSGLILLIAALLKVGRSEEHPIVSRYGRAQLKAPPTNDAILPHMFG